MRATGILLIVVLLTGGVATAQQSPQPAPGPASPPGGAASPPGSPGSPPSPPGSTTGSAPSAPVGHRQPTLNGLPPDLRKQEQNGTPGQEKSDAPEGGKAETFGVPPICRDC